jgi:hypothetical protein
MRTKSIKTEHLNILGSQMWWCTSIIPALGRLRREDLEFEDSLDCKVRLSQKNKMRRGGREHVREGRRK